MNRWKHFTAVGLSLVLIGGQAVSVLADDSSISDLQEQQASTQADLNSVESSITDLENRKSAITSELDSYQSQLVTTIASIQTLDDQISAKQTEIDQTEQDLDAARKDAEKQYEGMKKRIQYLYEEGGENGWASLILTSETLGNVINNVDDTQSLYKYDRSELEAYNEATQKVQDLETQQVQEKSQLQAMKTEQESGKSHLEDLIAQGEAESDDFDTQLAEAYELADQYQTLISEQNAQIAKLTEQQQAEALAAAQTVAAESTASSGEETNSAQTAQAENTGASSAQQNAAASTETNSAAEQPANQASSDSGTTNTASSQTEQPAQNNSSNTGTQQTQTTEETTQPETVSYDSATGQAIVNYAMQFIGNPYVWGGTSLTNGCDCSGFVQQVFAHFGYSLPRTSYAQAGAGTGVSYSEAQPGDIIVYSGHVGIYIGNGMLLNAANEEQGITVFTATYAPIQTVRRIVQ